MSLRTALFAALSCVILLGLTVFVPDSTSSQYIDTKVLHRFAPANFWRASGISAKVPAAVTHTEETNSTPVSLPTSSISFQRRPLGGQQDLSRTHLDNPVFDHVYVVSLPTRQDRRDQMRQLAQALQLNITFIDATFSTDPKIKWIAEHVYEVRQQKAKHLASLARGKSRGQQAQVGGMGVGSVWLARQGQRSASGKRLRLPSTHDWVSELYNAIDNNASASSLQPQNPDFDITAKLHDPKERIDSRQLNPAVLSTWYSHVEAWRTMQRHGDKKALFLEDDVDMEWDFGSRWSAIENKLPQDWQAVFAGHCWGREMTYPTGLHPHLFHSNIPRCLHGYVLSDTGVSSLLPYTRDPWTAFQAPIDVLIPTLLLSVPLQVYSVDPPLIIQAKELESDIQPGKGSKWRGRLSDSTLERIWRDQGKKVGQVTWVREWETDPAINRPHKDGQTW